MASILSECCWGPSPGREEPGAQGGLWSVERPRLDQSRRLDQSPRLSRLWPWEATPSLQLQLSHLSRGKGKAPPRAVLGIKRAGGSGVLAGWPCGQWLTLLVTPRPGRAVSV